MASILTARQTSELRKAIVQYMTPLLEDHPETLATIHQVLDTDADETTVAQYLEKKWSTVLRLQKRILDLENEVGMYKAAIDAANADGTHAGGAGNIVPSRDRQNWLPAAVAKTFPTSSAQIVNSVAVHPSLPLLVCGCADGSMVAWNLAGDTDMPQKSWMAHTRSVHRVQWSPVPVDISSSEGYGASRGGKTHRKAYLLASCSSDLSIKIWEGDALKQVRTLTGHEHTVSGIAFSKTDPRCLYSVSRDRTVKIWDLATGHCIRTFVGHSDWVRDIDVVRAVPKTLSMNGDSSFSNLSDPSELGDFLVTCSNDQSVRLSHHSGTGLSMLLGHSHVIETVRFLPMLANRHLDRYITQNLDRFPYLSQAIVDNPVYSTTLGFKYCVSAGRDNTLKIWLLPPPTLLPHRPPMPSVQNNAQGWHVMDLLGHQSWVKSVEIHPNGRFIISGADDKTIKIWDLGSLLESGKVTCVKTLAAHEGFVNAVHFARFELSAISDGPSKPLSDEDTLKLIEKSMRCLFVSAGTDNTVKMWS